MNAQNEVNDLQKQEQELYAEIGKKTVATYELDSFGEITGRLKLI